MAKVSGAGPTGTAGGEIGDSTILLLFGGIAVLLIGTVWAAKKAADDLLEGAEDVLEGVKDIPGDVWDAGGDASRGFFDRVAESGEYYGRKAAEAKLAEYQADKITTGAQIEAKRAAQGASNYGTVDGSLGAKTGEWYALEADASGSPRCYVLAANQYASNSWRTFTGGYCRRAKEQGLL